MLHNKYIQLLLQNRYKRGLQEYNLNHVILNQFCRIRYKTQRANSYLPHTCVEYLRQHNWIGSLNWSACIRGYFLRCHYHYCHDFTSWFSWSCNDIILVWAMNIVCLEIHMWDHHYSYFDLPLSLPFSLVIWRSTLRTGHCYNLKKRDTFLGPQFALFFASTSTSTYTVYVRVNSNCDHPPRDLTRG
jgi:hypothetical protein